MVAALGIVDPEADRHVLEELGLAIQVGGHVEDELAVAARLQVIVEEGAHAPVGIGLGLGQQGRLPILASRKSATGTPAAGSPLPRSRTWVLMVGREAATGILRAMGDLRLSVGDLNFTARWEADAPRTRDALRAGCRSARS